jgi:hypothetical protein
MKIGVEVLCKSLPRRSEFCENSLTYRYTIPGGVYGFLPLLSIYIYIYVRVYIFIYLFIGPQSLIHNSEIRKALITENFYSFTSLLLQFVNKL